MRHLLKGLVIITLLLVGIGSVQANIITNGSFESGTYSGAPYDTLGTGSTAITDWTVSSGDIDWIYTYWTPSDGVRSLDLNGNTVGGISITSGFSTTTGQQYLLLFDLAGNPDGPPSNKNLTVSVGDVVNQPFLFNTSSKTHNNMGWITESLLFNATGPTTFLTFTSTTNGNYGPALDNVRIDPVPEPSSLLFLASGLGALGLAARGRQKKIK
jgi:choice-of-anchor C domain-containing protein